MTFAIGQLRKPNRPHSLPAPKTKHTRFHCQLSSSSADSVGPIRCVPCAASKQHQEPDDSIRIRIEARLKRCGKEMRLVISPDSSKRQIITPLLKAVVRAHQWRKGVLAGEVPNRKLAANRLNLKQEYFRRVLGCAFLAPDIIEAILDGNYPSDLTVKKLCWRQLPIDWAEQRIRLGFSARPLQSMR
jgi:hypothetical protein